MFSLPLPLPTVLCSYTYRTCRELIPPAIKQSASTTSCATPVSPPKASSSSDYLVTCGTVYHLARPHHRPAVATHQQQQTRRQARRRGYATMQRHWRSNRRRCIKNILGAVEDAKQLPRATMAPYWTTVFRQPATVTMPECTQHPVQDSILSPIRAEKIRAARP